MNASTELQPAPGWDLEARKPETIDLFKADMVVDVSHSMATYMRVINMAVNRTIDQLARETAASDQVRLSVHSFADDAKVEIPSQSPNSIVADVDLADRGGTSYHTAFDLLSTTIPSDVAALVDERDQLAVATGRPHRIVRPVVFFLSDGAPTDSLAVWRASYERLMGLTVFPKIVTFGIGQADETVLRQISTARHFQAADGADVATAIAEVFASVSRSLIDSATAGRGVIVPEHVPGTVVSDPIEFLDL